MGVLISLAYRQLVFQDFLMGIFTLQKALIGLFVCKNKSKMAAVVFYRGGGGADRKGIHA